jgi:DNA-binding FadR family transcriptional regulator
LLQFINMLWDRCRLTSNVQARDLGHRDRSDEDHTRIMTAVRARDARLAAGIIADHVRHAMDEIQEPRRGAR